MTASRDRQPRRPLVERLTESRSLWSGYWSLVAHLVLGVLLAVLALERRPAPPRPKPILIDSREMPAATAAAGGGEAGTVLVASPATPVSETVARESIDETVHAAADAVEIAADMPVDHSVAEPVAAEATSPMTSAEDARAEIQAAAPAEAAPASSSTERRSVVDGGPNGRFGNRRGAGRAAACQRNGGTAASEAAVERGLAWLAAHQATDGSWRCDLSGCRCDGACRDPGTVASTTASTAIALLPFLGAGHTHEEGDHQQTVSRGIYYLTSRLKQTPQGADLCEGTMYGQGLATLVFAEAFGMTGDDLLRDTLAECIRFIETAQDQYSGGWRYLPGQPGDITVTAWQLAALKSASLAGLTVPSPAIDGAVRFLDRVQSMQGEAYGYRSPSAKHSTSAIGLLCRMYTGWRPGDQRLARGIERLASRAPDPNAVYENFYLSQLLIQAGHPAWPRWNTRFRDALVRLQSRGGHEAGSWIFDDRDTAPGGRLAHTALAVLSLEVYYRLLPIYGQRAVEDGF